MSRSETDALAALSFITLPRPANDLHQVRWIMERKIRRAVYDYQQKYSRLYYLYRDRYEAQDEGDNADDADQLSPLSDRQFIHHRRRMAGPEQKAEQYP